MKLNIIFLGTTQGYGYTFSASNMKTEFLSRGMYEQGSICTIINGVVGLKQKDNRELLNKVFASVISYKSRFNQFIDWILNAPQLYRDMKQLRREGMKNVVVLEFPDYHVFLLYVLLSRMLGYKITVISHEWGPTVKSTHWMRKPSVWIYAKTFGYFVDGILPISEYIIQKTKHFGKPYSKVPVLAEFNGIPVRDSSDLYFLYCVYAAYTRVIIPVIEAYMEYLKSANSNYKLILVLGGSDTQVGIITDYLKIHGYEKSVNILRKVPYDELMRLYKNAAALIIPLDPNVEQDCARFSQKIAEYTSSASPIISCNVGEVGHYFKDKESAILCDYSKKGFVNAFLWITEHPLEAERIGKKGYEIGERYFNYKIVGEQLSDFLADL